MKLRALTLCVALLSFLALPGCDDDPVAPETGSVAVDVTTTGDGTDEDGYQVTLGDASEDVEVDGSVTFENVVVGTHEVELTGLADGCEVDGDNPVGVAVESGDEVPVAFEVVCGTA